VSGEAEFDENRELCDDGNCLGVIVDGKCNVCGQVSTDATSPRDPSSGQTGNATAPRDHQGGDTGGSAKAAGSDDEAFDDDRQLCADGACTGIIGSDGKCKECGRPAAS
jgi:hypothetical protein